MFQLLVKSDGWSGSRDAMPLDRIFEYTHDSLVAKYLVDGGLRGEQLVTLPALFVRETGGVGNEGGRVGTVSRVSTSGRQIVIEYVFDEYVPPLSNSYLEAHTRELDIHSFEFSRTHWAVKDVDLFKVLFKSHVTSSPISRVFGIDKLVGIDETVLSVMMPFDAGFADVYASIQAAARDLKMQCLRADDIWEHAAIIQDIVSLINRSRIVIGDCTGRNPNVFYEIGVAHTLGRDLIPITQSGDDIPFDLRHLRYLSYRNDAEGRARLSEGLKQRIRTILERRGG